MSKSIYDKLNLINQETDKIKVMLVNSKQLTAEEATLENIPPAIQALIESSGGSVEANPYEELYMQRTANETSMVGLFAYTPASTTLDLSSMNTSKVNDMSYMFSECKVPYLDLSGFDVSNVTKMDRMFQSCTSEININGWDTSKLTNANYMFQYFGNKNKYIDLSVLDFSNVIGTTDMFGYCNVDYIDIRNINLNLSKIDKMPFNNVSGKILDLSNYDITGLKKTYQLCYFCSCKTVDLTNWKTTEVTDMRNTFYYARDVEKLIIPDWDMTNVTNTTNFFYSCDKLNYIDLSRSNDTTIAKIATLVPTRKLATYGQIIIPADSSQANIEALIAKYWKPVGPRLDMTSCEVITEVDEFLPNDEVKFSISNSEPWYGNDVNVEYVSSDETIATVDKETMTITSTGIEGTTEITARISDTQEVISEPFVFSVSAANNYPGLIRFKVNGQLGSAYYIITVNGISKKLSDLKQNSITGTYSYNENAPITSIRFHFQKNTTNDISEIIITAFNTNNLTSMEYMFNENDRLTSLNINDWDTSNVKNMKSSFRKCSKLTELNLSNWNTSKATTMCEMFSECSSLTSLDLSGFDTSNVTNMENMFNYCSSLTSLDLSSFDTSNVIFMNGIFGGCSSLISLDLSNWNIEKIQSYNFVNVFKNCNSLHTLRLDNCNNTTISKIVTSISLPTGTVNGITRKIYCKEANASGLTAPNGWVFEYVKEEPDPYVSGQFKGNTEITEVNTIVTSEHTDLLDMFQGCTNLTTVDASDWDTSNVTSMERMFSSCRSLTELDLSDLNTSQVTNMQNMFSGCSNLISLDLSNFDMSNVVGKTSSMFAACTSLQTLRLDNCSYDTINKIIISYLFPTKVINGVTRKIYCKEENARGLVAPTNWVFEFIE